MEGLFEVNNYDGIQASTTWRGMNDHEKLCKFLGQSRPVWYGTGAFSIYHLARFNSLSASGKYMAGFGAVFSLWAIASISSERKHLRIQAGLD